MSERGEKKLLTPEMHHGCQYESPNGRGVCGNKPTKWYASCTQYRCNEHSPGAMDGE